MIKNKFKYRFLFICSFTCIWVIINDGIGLYNYFLGIIVSILCLYISSKLLGFDYVKTFSLPAFPMIKYLFFMFISIYKAGFITTYRIITGKIAPTILDFHIDPSINNVLLHHIIGTSITLTPGTITIENVDKKLKVLCLHFEKDEELPSVQFEKHLVKMEDA